MKTLHHGWTATTYIALVWVPCRTIDADMQIRVIERSNILYVSGQTLRTGVGLTLYDGCCGMAEQLLKLSDLPR
jgi:hypothetical protein